MFATDYKIDLLEITISDFTELIPRPKDDISESPVIDPKTDSKKKNASKKAAAAAAKNSNYSIPESVVNEFGVTHKTMRTLGVSACQTGSLRRRRQHSGISCSIGHTIQALTLMSAHFIHTHDK